MKKLNKGLTIIAATMLSTTLFAANQGALTTGDTSIVSSGDFEVTLDIENSIQINNLKDISLGSFKSGIDTTKSQFEDFCVFTNASSFSLTISGGHTSGFGLEEATNTALVIPYSVQLATKDQANTTSSFQDITHNQTLTGINETRNRKDCLMQDNSSTVTKNNMVIQVSVTEDNLLDAIPGNYKDTITLVASPE
jgi:hypothetical protein